MRAGPEAAYIRSPRLRTNVAEIRGNHIIGIEEKPKVPKRDYAVIGIYFYYKIVFKKIQHVKPSARGELEITDVNNSHIEEGTLTYEIWEGWWTDAGPILLHPARQGSMHENYPIL